MTTPWLWWVITVSNCLHISLGPKSFSEEQLSDEGFSDLIDIKLTPVTDSIFCCRSGSAADTQAITDIVKYRLNFMEIDQGRPASVRDAAWAFKEIAYEYRDSLMAGLIGKSESEWSFVR